MEARQFAEHFFLREVVSNVVADQVAASANLKGGRVVADGRDCLEGLSAAETDEELRLACTSFSHQSYLLLAGPRLPPQQKRNPKHHSNHNQVQIQMTAGLSYRCRTLHTFYYYLTVDYWCRCYVVSHSQVLYYSHVQQAHKRQLSAVTFLIFIIMNAQTRLLPHLNSYFLQRKAYELHRRKVDEIKASAQKKRRIFNQRVKEGNQANSVREEQLKYSIHTIKEEIKTELNVRLSPLTKRRKRETVIENDRLLNSIQKCSSTINRKQIDRHMKQNQQLKSRLSKFICSPSSHKTLMKCKYSLQIMRQREKERASPSLLSREPSRENISRSQLMPLPHKYRRLSFEPSSGSQLNRLQMLKNSSKIREHFNRSEFRPQAESNYKTAQQSAASQSRRRLATDVRYGKCFTTQVEEC